MTRNRRDFLSRASQTAAAAAALGALPPSIARALAAEPARATGTIADVQHIVILMQENRSFDHSFGTLRGVRGFGDPRAVRLPDGLPVWAQPDPAGRRFLPFRMDIDASRATWMGSLPHSWADQTDSRNGGRYDRWLHVKQSGHREYALLESAQHLHVGCRDGHRCQHAKRHSHNGEKSSERLLEGMGTDQCSCEGQGKCH